MTLHLCVALEQHFDIDPACEVRGGELVEFCLDLLEESTGLQGGADDEYLGLLEQVAADLHLAAVIVYIL